MAGKDSPTYPLASQYQVTPSNINLLQYVMAYPNDFQWGWQDHLGRKEDYSDHDATLDYVMPVTTENNLKS